MKKNIFRLFIASLLLTSSLTVSCSIKSSGLEDEFGFSFGYIPSTIVINDVNNSPSTIKPVWFNQPSGATTYTVNNPIGGILTINSSTGAITVTPNGTTVPPTDITVTATTSDGTYTAKITVEIGTNPGGGGHDVDITYCTSLGIGSNLITVKKGTSETLKLSISSGDACDASTKMTADPGTLPTGVSITYDQDKQEFTVTVDNTADDNAKVKFDITMNGVPGSGSTGTQLIPGITLYYGSGAVDISGLNLRFQEYDIKNGTTSGTVYSSGDTITLSSGSAKEYQVQIYNAGNTALEPGPNPVSFEYFGSSFILKTKNETKKGTFYQVGLKDSLSDVLRNNNISVNTVNYEGTYEYTYTLTGKSTQDDVSGYYGSKTYTFKFTLSP